MFPLDHSCSTSDTLETGLHQPEMRPALCSHVFLAPLFCKQAENTYSHGEADSGSLLPSTALLTLKRREGHYFLLMTIIIIINFKKF